MEALVRILPNSSDDGGKVASSSSDQVGATYYTPEITNMNIYWKMPLKSIGQFQWSSRGDVTILLTIPLTSDNNLENTTEYPLEYATGNPRCFPRCRFLACNLLPLTKVGARASPCRGVHLLCASIRSISASRTHGTRRNYLRFARSYVLLVFEPQ